VTQHVQAERRGVNGRTVILRADLANGLGIDLIEEIAAFAQAGARVAVIAGFGSPGGDFNAALSLRGFAKPLQDLSGIKVSFISECVGTLAESALAHVPFGEAALMENLRFHTDERRDSRNFALRLSALGDYFAVTGKLRSPPARWIVELSSILPSPEMTLVTTPTKEMS